MIGRAPLLIFPNDIRECDVRLGSGTLDLLVLYKNDAVKTQRALANRFLLYCFPHSRCVSVCCG